MTVEEALAIVERILPQGRLSKIQEAIFRQSWEGLSYTDIARTSGYDAGYIKDIGSNLWQVLSKVLGEKVTKHNFRGVLQRFIQQEATTQPGLQQPIPPLILPTVPAAIAHNLPARDFNQIVGRDRELAQLLEVLSFDCPTHCLSIEGIGGMGKTTLALSAAYHHLQPQFTLNQGFKEFFRASPTFEAIIFTSAKQERLTPQGVLPRLRPERSLRDLFRDRKSVV